MEHPSKKEEGEMILNTGVRPCNLIYLIFITPATTQGGRGHWAVYYTSTQSLIIMFSYSFA